MKNTISPNIHHKTSTTTLFYYMHPGANTILKQIVTYGYENWPTNQHIPMRSNRKKLKVHKLFILSIAVKDKPG